MPIQSCGQSVSAQRGKRYTEIGLFAPPHHRGGGRRTACRSVCCARQRWRRTGTPITRDDENKHSNRGRSLSYRHGQCSYRYAEEAEKEEDEEEEEEEVEKEAEG